MMSKKLTIAMIIPCNFPSRQGTQVFILNLAKALNFYGHDIHLFTYGQKEYNKKFPFHVHRAANIPTGFRSGPHILKPIADIALFLSLCKMIKKYPFDIIHAHNIEGIALGILLKTYVKLPLIYHIHNSMYAELPTYFKQSYIKKIARLLGGMLDTIFPKFADKLIVFDKKHQSFYTNNVILPKKTNIIPLGIDMNQLKHVDPQKINSLKKELGRGPFILYTGNPDAYQNLELLWESFSLVYKKRSDIKLIILSHHQKEFFTCTIPKHISQKNILFRKYNDLHTLKAYLNISDIGVCPRSLWCGFPVKLLNYLSVGLPFIACQSSLKNTLDNPLCKLTEDTPKAFSSAILELLEKSINIKNKKQNCDKWDIYSQIPMYEKLYKNTISDFFN